MCFRDEDSSCPFSFTDVSESVQGLGCLPSPFEIINMRVSHGKTWACHKHPDRPCKGTISHLREEGLPFEVVDKELVTEKDNWWLYSTK